MRENKTVAALGEGAVTFIGVVITVMVIGIGIVVYQVVEKIGEKLEAATTQVAVIEYKEYESGWKSGDTVINVIDATERNPDRINITVTTLARDTSIYGYGSDGKYTGYNVTDPRLSEYINPIGQFSSAVLTTNGTVTGITFTQEN